MQAIARANRVYPGKDCGLIVDYNGMLKSLREALAQYALGDEDGGGGGDGGGVVAPIEDYLAALPSGHRSRRESPARARLRPDTPHRGKGLPAHRSPARRRGRAVHVRRSQTPLRDHGPRGLLPLQGPPHGAVGTSPTPSATTTSRRSTRSCRSGATSPDVTEVLKELHRSSTRPSAPRSRATTRWIPSSST
jgi:hypothetical protein